MQVRPPKSRFGPLGCQLALTVMVCLKVTRLTVVAFLVLLLHGERSQMMAHQGNYTIDNKKRYYYDCFVDSDAEEE